MNNEDLKQPMTRKYLGEFTETVLLPAVSSLMDEKLKNFASKSYLDDKLEKFATKEDLNRKFVDFEDKMDDKFANLKGDLIILMRKEDRKLAALVELLKNKKVISENDAKQIIALEPFPKT